MTTLTYNGITLTLLGTEGVSYEAVYEGPNQLHTKVTLGVRVSLVPSENYISYTRRPGAQVAIDPDASGVETLEAISNRLMAPRQKLSFIAGSTPLFALPPSVLGPQDQAGGLGRATQDSQGGPRPISFVVSKVLGNTVWASYVIEFYVRDSYLLNRYTALKSHLFQVSETYDSQMFRIREIRGRMLFDSADLERAQKIPDFWESVIPKQDMLGWRREAYRRQVTADGYGMDYHVIWREETCRLSQSCRDLISRIETTVSSNSTYAGWVSIASQAIEATVNAGANLLNAGAAGTFSGMTPAVGMKISTAIAAGGIISGILGSYPQTLHQVVVKLFGFSGLKPDQSDLGRMRRLATDVVCQRLTQQNNVAVMYELLSTRGYRWYTEYNLNERSYTLIAQVPELALGVAIVGSFTRPVRPDGTLGPRISNPDGVVRLQDPSGVGASGVVNVIGAPLPPLVTLHTIPARLSTDAAPSTPQGDKGLGVEEIFTTRRPTDKPSRPG